MKLVAYGRGSFLFLIALGTACAADTRTSPSVTPIHVGAYVDRGSTAYVQEIASGLALTSVEIIELRAAGPISVASIDFWGGRARLSDGRCLQLQREGPTAELAGAVVWPGQDMCKDVPEPGASGNSYRCNAQSVPEVLNWKISCGRLGTRTAIIANSTSMPAKAARLTVLNHAAQLVGVLPTHEFAVVKILGTLPNGRTAILTFFWNPAKTAQQSSESKE